ncbi:hypothetical protein H2200_009153 [Cladophialophora chaetospira]|uniref:O-methyltransferase domain-containing protein n=1 Tax=Cladophialophora chaetospira TaxID=386627 RepID=A0AA38X3L8_9EURO|nr:hypothetical protein H2200_009153 [Cladophialophora chaetospira]
MSPLTTLADSLSSNLRELDAQLTQSQGSPPHLWDAKPYSGLDNTSQIPSQAAFQLIDKIRTDLRAAEALVTPTHFKLVELGLTQYKVAALNTAVSLKVADALVELGGHASLRELAEKVDTNEHKLGKIMRVLTGDYIFQEVSKDCFKHSRHSVALAGSPGARSFMSFITDLGMRCALGIPGDLTRPDTKNSFAEKDAPFVKEVSKGKTFFEYMMDPNNAEMVELANVGVQLTRMPLLVDYPWGELGEATVVDVGCGAGDSGIDVMKMYPQIKWAFQDLSAQVLADVKKAIPEELRNRSISFVEHDYFNPNVSRGNVWYMRGVLHEYVDEGVLKILQNLAAAMRETPNSKLIINEVCAASPVIAPADSMSPPSEHIPEQQSALADIGNLMTWSTFSLFGGKERSYEEYEKLLLAAGFKVSRFFRFRTFTVMLECELA